MHELTRKDSRLLWPEITKPPGGLVPAFCVQTLSCREIAANPRWMNQPLRLFRLLVTFFFVVGSLTIVGNAQEVSPSSVCPQPSESQQISTPVAVAAHSTDQSQKTPDGTGSTEASGATAPFRALLTESFSSDWHFFPSDPDAPSVWSLRREPTEQANGDEEFVLVCSGAVKGFAYTKAKFSDFELKLEWRFPSDNSGNSGVLLFTQSEPRIWPTSLQLQLHQPTAGSLIPSGDAKAETTQDADGSLVRPIGEWNECRIVCNGGTVTVEINGKRAGQATGVTPHSGSIALQSEGSEVHFRRIQIRPLPAPATPSSEPSTSSADSKPEPKP